MEGHVEKIAYSVCSVPESNFLIYTIIDVQNNAIQISKFLIRFTTYLVVLLTHSKSHSSALKGQTAEFFADKQP
jgi:hypothetical protein